MSLLQLQILAPMQQHWRRFFFNSKPWIDSKLLKTSSPRLQILTLPQRRRRHLFFNSKPKHRGGSSIPEFQILVPMQECWRSLLFNSKPSIDAIMSKKSCLWLQTLEPTRQCCLQSLLQLQTLEPTWQCCLQNPLLFNSLEGNPLQIDTN
jgi:hypothetical protein